MPAAPQELLVYQPREASALKQNVRVLGHLEELLVLKFGQKQELLGYDPQPRSHPQPAFMAPD